MMTILTFLQANSSVVPQHIPQTSEPLLPEEFDREEFECTSYPSKVSVTYLMFNLLSLLVIPVVLPHVYVLRSPVEPVLCPQS